MQSQGEKPCPRSKQDTTNLAPTAPSGHGIALETSIQIALFVDPPSLDAGSRFFAAEQSALAAK